MKQDINLLFYCLLGMSASILMIVGVIIRGLQEEKSESVAVKKD